VTAFYADAQIVGGEGEGRTWSRPAHSGGVLETTFCAECGAAVIVRASAMPGLAGIPVGAFTDPGFPAPDAFYWTRARHAWAGPLSGIADIETQ
jgi:hypothetical protein